MLNVGATTFWEVMQLDGYPFSEGFGSLCHGWSGYPAAILPRVLGFRSRTSNGFLLSPCRNNLEFAEVEIPTPGGRVYLRSEWDEAAHVWRYSGRLPSGMSGSIALPNQTLETIETMNCSRDGITQGGEPFEIVVRFAG